MSREQDYFPPKGTKWKWGNNALNHLAWHCDLPTQREPGVFLHPLNVHLIVDMSDGKWYWRCEVTDWQYRHSDNITGSSNDPLQACLAAEAAGEATLDKFMPDWVRTALANKWRPPCAKVR